LGEK
jgi:hypothetical protein